MKLHRVVNKGDELISSLNEISDIILMSIGNKDGLYYVKKWVQAMPKKKFNLILYHYDEEAKKEAEPILAEIKKYSDIQYTFIDEPAAKKVHENEAKSFIRNISNASNAFFLEMYFLADSIVVTYTTDGDNRERHFYIINHSWDQTTMETFISKQFPGATVEALPDTVLLQGGNFLNLGDHIFVGRTFLTLNASSSSPADARQALIDSYKLASPTPTIDFIGPDPAYDPNNILYHLDLILTSTGKDENGIWQFFIPFVPKDTISGNDRAKQVSQALDSFVAQATEIFEEYYKGKYRIIRIPAYVNKETQFIYSPVNGIVERVNDVGRFYFPEVTGMPENFEGKAQLLKYQKEAFETYVNCLGEKNVIKTEVFFGDVFENSKSLHCMMSVVGRK